MKLGKILTGITLACVAITMVGCKREVGREVTSQTVTKQTVKTVATKLGGVDVNKNASALATRRVSNARTVLDGARAAGDEFALEEVDTLVAITPDGDVESYIEPIAGAGDDAKFEVEIEKQITVKYSNGDTKTVTVKETKTLTAEEMKKGWSVDTDEDLGGKGTTEESSGSYELGEELKAAGDDIEEVLDTAVAEKAEIVMPAVLETYQCKYEDQIESEAKGVYIVYEKASVETQMSQLGYVYPDGTYFDIFNFDSYFGAGEAGSNRWIDINHKAEGGTDYLIFDKRGNAYVLGYDFTKQNGLDSLVIYKFNPTKKQVLEVPVTVPGDTLADDESYYTNDFTVDDEGTNIFMNVHKTNENENVFSSIVAVRLNGTDSVEKTTVLFTCPGYSTGPTLAYYNKALWFEVCNWEDESNYHSDCGIYIAKPDSKNNYKAENVTAEKVMFEFWLRDCIKANYNKATKTYDYKAILDYIFSFCDPDVEKEFRLDRLFDSKEGYGNEWEFLPLYTEKTNEEALKVLLDVGTDNTIKLLENFNNSWDIDGDGREEVFHKFCSYCWNHIGSSRVPLEKLVFEKGKTTTAYTTSEEFYTSDMKDVGINLTYSRFYITEDGLYYTAPKWDSDVDGYVWSELYQLTDSTGKIIGKKIKSIDGYKAVKIPLDTGYGTNKIDLGDTTTWRRFPVTVNESGNALFMIDYSKKTIWKYADGEAQNILSNDSSAGNIDEIITFSTSKDSVFYNAKSGNTYFTKKIDLNDLTSKAIKLDEQLGQIMEYRDTQLDTDGEAGVMKIDVSIADNSDVEVADPVKKGTKVTLKTTKMTETNGYTVQWECLGRVIGTTDTLVLDTTKFGSNSVLPITVYAEKDGKRYSSTINVKIN